MTSVEPSSNLLGVNVGDEIVFQIIENTDPFILPPYDIGTDKFTCENLTANLNPNFSIIVTDKTDTNNTFGETVIQVLLDSGTYAVNMENPIAPGKFYIASTNWTY